MKSLQLPSHTHLPSLYHFHGQIVMCSNKEIFWDTAGANYKEEMVDTDNAEDIEEDEDAIEDDNEIDEDLCAISIVEIPASVKSS